jgi:hypothetical protein
MSEKIEQFYYRGSVYVGPACEICCREVFLNMEMDRIQQTIERNVSLELLLDSDSEAYTYNIFHTIRELIILRLGITNTMP